MGTNIGVRRFVQIRDNSWVSTAKPIQLRKVPASEAWLFENPQALASVKQGLKESAEGKRISRSSFAKHAKE
jgi:hypothetical protein